MSTWQRMGVALFYTFGLAIGAIFYAEVFQAELVPLVNPDGIFSQPVFIMVRIIPIILLVILAAAWIWVIAGAVQDEKTVRRRRVR